jgi:hypothetical protein
MRSKRKLRPVLDGDFWMVGDNPDLGPLQGNTDPARGPVQECVDHHVFQSPDGAWHLWGCVRHTAVGRVLYHWEAASVTDQHWRQTGEVIRVDRGAGECLNGVPEEVIQSPFIARKGRTYYMFYGGSAAGTDEAGSAVPPGDPRMAGQICMMTSRDGRTWTCHHNGLGRSRVFIGPSASRDPCVLKVGRRWHLYYAGFHGEGCDRAAFFARTSGDQLRWSDWRVVHEDLSFGAQRWDTECPHVVHRGGDFYLFRTVEYASANTHVFRSEDPLDFGVGDARDKYVGPIAVAAPEVIVAPDGQEYITSNHDLTGGTRICHLTWVEE